MGWRFVYRVNISLLQILGGLLLQQLGRLLGVAKQLVDLQHIVSGDDVTAVGLRQHT